MARPPKFSVSQIEDALRKAAGVQTLAADLMAQAGTPINRNTIAEYLKRYPELREAYAAILDRNLDIAEAKLLGAIRDDGHPSQMTAIIFYLKTKGRERGYSQSIQIEHSVRQSFADAVAESEGAVLEHDAKH